MNRSSEASILAERLSTKSDQAHQQGLERKAWTAWATMSSRSKLAPMTRTHLEGILSEVVLKTPSAVAESKNAWIRRIKAMACRYRNRERFRNATRSPLGGLDLYPWVTST